MSTTGLRAGRIEELLAGDASKLLAHQCKTDPERVSPPAWPGFHRPDLIPSDRPIRVLSSLQTLLNHGRLASTGYVSILPVDQGVEHSAGASFAPNPIYFDPENIVELAIEGGCNAVASTLGTLGSVARKYATRFHSSSN